VGGIDLARTVRLHSATNVLRKMGKAALWLFLARWLKGSAAVVARQGPAPAAPISDKQRTGGWSRGLAAHGGPHFADSGWCKAQAVANRRGMLLGLCRPWSGPASACCWPPLTVRPGSSRFEAWWPP